MAPKQNEQHQQSTRSQPESEGLKGARDRYKFSMTRITELQELLEAETDEGKCKKLEEDISAEIKIRRSRKSRYKTHLVSTIQELEKRSDGAALEASKEEMKEMEQDYLVKLDKQKDIDRLGHLIADLDRRTAEAQVSNAQDAQDQVKKLKQRRNLYNYRRRHLEEEQTAKNALETLQEKLQSTTEKSNITPEKRRETERKAAKKLAGAQETLDDLKDFAQKSDILKKYLADIEMEKGKEAVPKSPEELWKVLSKFEGLQTTIIGQKTAAATRAKEEIKGALAVQKGLDKIKELEHHIEEAKRVYDDAVFKRRKVYGNTNRTTDADNEDD